MVQLNYMFDLEWFMDNLSAEQKTIPILIVHGLGTEFTRTAVVRDYVKSFEKI